MAAALPDLSGSSSTAFSNALSLFGAVQDTPLKKPKKTQIIPIGMLAASRLVLDKKISPAGLGVLKATRQST